MKRDNLDLQAAEHASPVIGRLRGYNGKIHFVGKEKSPADLKATFLFDSVDDGWQFLQAGKPPEYVMRTPGGPKPEQPHVDKKHWVKNLNGVVEHPWRWTTFARFIEIGNGEASTFVTSTTGGAIAVRELLAQVKVMRERAPGAKPVIALDTVDFPTSYGVRARPHFRIVKWHLPGGDTVERDEPPKAIAFDASANKVVENLYREFDDPVGDLIGS